MGTNQFKDDLYNRLIHRVQGMNPNEIVNYIFRDTISNCKNEKYLTQLVKKPHKEPSSAIIMFDICGFQNIDTKYGTRYGQKVLATVANVIQKNFSAECDVIRYYGDVFVVVMYNVTSDDVLYHISDVLSAVSNVEFEQHPSIVLRAVAGASITDEISYESLTNADVMLQKAKKNKLKALIEHTTDSWSKEFSLDEFGYYK